MQVETSCIVEIRMLCQTFFGKVQISGRAHLNVQTLWYVHNEGLSWSDHMDAQTETNVDAEAFPRIRRLKQEQRTANIYVQQKVRGLKIY